MTDPIREVIARYWDGRAHTYDAVGLHIPESAAERGAWARIRDLLSPTERTIDVLDVGCGTGFLALLFAEVGHRVASRDLAPAMIEQAQQKARALRLAATFLVEDAGALSAPDQSFDLVVSRHLFWTLPHPEQAMREWVRVTRPGERVAIIDNQWIPQLSGVSDQYGRNLAEALPYQHGGASADEVAALMQRAGLSDVAVDPLEDWVAAERSRLEAEGRTSRVYAHYLVWGSRPR